MHILVVKASNLNASNNTSVVACIRCIGNVYIEPLPSNCKRDTHLVIQADGRFMKYVFEMGSGAMIYIPSFRKLVQAIRRC
jgi:hypothetical protein